MIVFTAVFMTMELSLMIPRYLQGSFLFITAFFITVLAGCTPPDGVGPVNTDASLALHACQQDELDSRNFSRALQCGTLPVPENPNRPDGRQIALNIVRLPAIAADPEPDPLFVLAGGPGQAATEVIQSLGRFRTLVNRKRDIVFVDQRGTGKSAPLDCVFEEDLELTLEQAMAAQQARLKECLDGYDADLRWYTTPWAMDDIDTVRRVLGYDRINLWGGSYGTRAGLVYLRRHPETVRTLVLDSVAPVGINLPHHMLADSDRALRRLFEHCAADPACEQRFGDLATRTRQLIADLDVNPRRVDIEDPLTQETLSVTMSGQLLAGFLRLGLYSRELGPIMPWLIDALANGDYRPAAVLFQSGGEMQESISLGMQFTVLCAEDIGQGADEIPADESILQLRQTESMAAICDFWPAGELPDNYREPVASDKPVLLLSGDLDPVTPPRWGERAAESLSNSLHLVVPGSHHGASRFGCVPRLIDEFIAAGDGAALETDCIQRIQPAAPFVSSAGPAMLEINEPEGEAADD